MDTANKVLNGIGIFFLLIIVIIIIFNFVIGFANDLVSRKAEKYLKKIPVPEKTTLVDSVNDSRKLVGNGNGMQYFAAIMVESKLTMGQLQAYYNEYEKNDNIIVDKQSSSRIEQIEHGDYYFEKYKEGKQYYIIYTWSECESTILRDFDIRGH